MDERRHRLRRLRRFGYVLGGMWLAGLVFTIASFPVRDSLPSGVVVPLWAAAVIAGAFYGNAQWRKNTPAPG